MNDEAILNEVLADFARLAEIPRPSLHERAAGDFICAAFRALGCRVARDEAHNVIADRAASPGMEDAPRVILQAHMDMVCVAAEGVAYDPLHDPIRLKRTAEFLMAEGTSLGADDGAGIAMILYVFRHAKDVGPLRAIITTDEETGMTGAQALDARYLSDAAYLINWDSENYDELTLGCAGSFAARFGRAVSWRPAPEGRAWRVAVRGLLGGHSGERIGDGRGNALRVLAGALLSLREAELAQGVAHLAGGTAQNAIPASAEAVFVSSAAEEALCGALAAEERFARGMLGDADPGLCLALEEAPPAARVMRADDAAAVMEALCVLHTGVFQMAPHRPGLVETSANLGVLRTSEKDVSFSYLVRSSVGERLAEAASMCRLIAARFGLAAEIGTPSPAWRERRESALAGTMLDVFAAQNGRAMKAGVIHAGLECGWLLQKNPRLDMASIGVTTRDIHTPNERLELQTVAPQVRLVLETLTRLARRG